MAPEVGFGGVFLGRSNLNRICQDTEASAITARGIFTVLFVGNSVGRDTGTELSGRLCHCAEDLFIPSERKTERVRFVTPARADRKND
jgi:hypothetical protein